MIRLGLAHANGLVSGVPHTLFGINSLISCPLIGVLKRNLKINTPEKSHTAVSPPVSAPSALRLYLQGLASLKEAQDTGEA